MVCTLHPNRQAISTCEICGQPFCEECLVNVKGKWYCKEHVAGLINPEAMRGEAEPAAHHGGENYYDQPHYHHGAPPPHYHYSYNYYGHGYYPYKNKIVALLLCIFLGVAGFHRFYVGKIGTGLLWLCTGGFCGIGVLIDIILIACGNFRDSRGYPLI